MLRLIVNPISGNGRALAMRTPVEAELEARGIEFETYESNAPGHITRLVREAAASGAAGVAVLGGDGTLFEAVNGLPDAPFTVLIVPCGTGNDFIKTLKFPKEPLEALRAQLDAPAQRLDVGQVNDLRFINVSGTGFDIEVLRQTLRFKKRFKGLFAYILGLIQAIRFFRPVRARITVDGQVFEKELTVIEVGNGQYIGGGMRAVPMADPGDGKLDVVWVDKVSKAGILRLLPKFITGKYVHLKITHAMRADDVVIEAPGMTVNVDGELIEMDRAEYTILPGRLIVNRPAAVLAAAPQPLRSEPKKTVASP